MDSPSPAPSSPQSPTEEASTGDTITRGMRFPDQKACTKALRRYAARHGKTIKLDGGAHGGAMLKYKCDGGEQCRFEVVALRSRRESQRGYYISRANLAHNMCVGRSHLTASQLKEDELIRSLVASDPTVCGNVIIEYVKRTRGVDVKRAEAYRARQLILDDLYGSTEDGFQKLESLVNTWKTKNPTSVVDCEFNGEGQFVRAFISHPYANSYNTSGQKVAGVEAAIVQHGKHRNAHLELIGKDGDDKKIVLAVAVCATENAENYEWFVRCCLRTGVDLNALPLFSSRGSGMMAALEMFGVPSLRYCTQCILQNIQEQFKGKCPYDMEDILYRVQAARNESEYEEELTTLALTRPEIATFIREIGPEHWVLYPALHLHRLYGWRSTNFEEFENAAASEPRQVPPFRIMQHYMEKFMQEANTRREIANRWRQEGHELAAYARSKLDEAASNAGFCKVQPSEGEVVYVHDTRNHPIRIRTVDVAARTCTCVQFDQYGIPCKHFIAALTFLKRPAERFTAVDSCYNIDAYLSLYGSDATPGIELVPSDELVSNTNHRSPKWSSKKQRRLPSKGDAAAKAGTAKRTCVCSNCGLPGHNRRGCPSKIRSDKPQDAD